jgi:hypothetical protein
MHIFKKRNSNMKHVAYTSLVGLQERSDRVKKKAAKNLQII